MSDVVARAREALATRRAQESPFWPNQLVVDLLDALDDAREELEHLRQYRVVPAEPVDFYSLEDVCKIRAEYEAELEHLRGLQRVDRDTALAAPEAPALNDRWAGFCRLSPDKARAFAAALFAEANAAEQSHHPDCPQEKP